jgi:hypothetical protein
MPNIDWAGAGFVIVCIAFALLGAFLWVTNDRKRQ